MSAVVESIYSEPVSPITETAIPMQREKLIHAGRMHWAHWMVVGLSIILTLGAWYIAKVQVDNSVEERFQREAEQVVELVKERMKLYENALWGGVSLIDSNKGLISYHQWLDYSNSLNIDEVYPGINGIGVIHNIKPDHLKAYLDRERIWRPDFALHPDHNEAEFWPITFVEPADINKKAIGLDMAFETNRYTGIQKARDTGIAQLTGPITLVQDAKKTPGFLFYTPFYKRGIKPGTLAERRENIVGVTYAPFITYKLMQGTLATQNRHVSIIISDGGELLYQDSGGNVDDNVDPKPLHHRQVTVDLYGRQWSFHIASNMSFRKTAANSQPLYILIGGIVIDSLLLSLFIFLSRANRRALSYADQMTNELRAQTGHLEKSNADLEQFAYIASHDLKSPLNAIQKLVGWIEEDMGDAVPEDSKGHLQLLRSRSERMSSLLDDLLAYSRVGRFDYIHEPLQLKRVGEDIFSLLDKPESFLFEVEEFELRVPRVPLEIVLRNLISNGIKHHDNASGSIEVCCEKQANKYQIRVQDDGPGIPSNLHHKALEMFQTLKPRDKIEGSGMGLALAKRIVEHYGGDLNIESDGSRGTGIVITWPIPE